MSRLFSRIAVLGALAVLAAAPRPASAAKATKTRQVAMKPLFDTSKRFKPKETVLLQFRVQDAKTQASLRLDDVSFLLLQGKREPAAVLRARKLKNGVFEVPFTPARPGRYELVTAVRGVPMGTIAPLYLGVVGVMDGLTEEPPEADAQVQHRGKGNPRTAGR